MAEPAPEVADETEAETGLAAEAAAAATGLAAEAAAAVTGLAEAVAADTGLAADVATVGHLIIFPVFGSLQLAAPAAEAKRKALATASTVIRTSWCIVPSRIEV